MIDSKESFKTCNPIGQKIHVKLDCDNNFIYADFQSPRQNGERRCTQIPCPEGYQDSLVCWRCCLYH